ncbi:MAG TPA: hypothetical protein PKE29_00035 [Phycisphaerales bacterium]|nr:hypothetical protein [Phycisphaerales bacterium]
MNTLDPDTPGDSGGLPPLDADLLPLLADLDRLAAIDRAAAAPGLEARLMGATLAPLHAVQPTAAQVAELASLDRASAPRDLEDGVFEATVPAIRKHAAGPRLVLHQPDTRANDRRHARAARPAWWTRTPVRLAALIAIVAGTTLAVRTSITPAPKERLADKVRREMDTLFAAMELQPTDRDKESATDFDPDKLSEWLAEGVTS